MWNETRIEFLRKLWIEERLPADICAYRLQMEFRERITRNAVCGKVDRMSRLKPLEWPRRRQTGAIVTRKQEDICAARKGRRQSSFASNCLTWNKPRGVTGDKIELQKKKRARQEAIVKTLLSQPELLAPAVEGRRVPIASLPADQCRWINGDPRHKDGPLYCTNTQFVDATGKRHVYCADHCCQAYPAMQEALVASGVILSQKEHAHV